MTIPRMEAISKRWERIPPLSVTTAMIATALGAKFGVEPKKENNLQALIDDLGDAGLGGGTVPEWAKNG